MANSYTEVTLSAQQQNGFTTPAYIKQEHLKVYVNNVLVDGNTSVFGTLTTTANLTYSFVTETATSLNFSETLPTNTIVRIDRNSSQNARLNDYSDASLLTADVMDQDANQMFFVAQEALDQASKTNLAAGTFYYAQGTAPTSVAVGTVWFNTDSSPNTLQVWCGDTEGWRFVAPVHETTRYTNASGIAFTVNGQPNSGTDAAYAGLAKITDTGFTSSSYFHLNGVKQVSGTLAEVNATPATADYVFDQANSNIWFKPIANTDVIVIESFSGSFSQEVTAKEAAALNHRNDAEKLAINAENSQFTLSDGVTTDYSAKHFKALAEAARDLALQYKDDTNQLKADTDQLKSDTAQLKADTTQLKADTLQAKTDALQAETDAQTAQGLAESARDTALSHKNLAQEYATKAEDTNITGGTDKSALHYAAKAAASASAASNSESNAASTLANAVTLNTSQTITGAKSFTGGISFPDGDIAGFGTSEPRGLSYNGNNLGDRFDLEIFHDGSNSYIRDYGSGNLAIQGTDVSIRDNSGNRRIFAADGSTGSVALYYGDSSSGSKLDTTSLGVNVTGTVTADGLSLGNGEFSLLNGNLKVQSIGDNSYIDHIDTNSSKLFVRAEGATHIKSVTADKLQASFEDSEVSLWHDGNKVLATEIGGVNVTGTVTADGLNVDTNNNSAFIDVGTAYLDVKGSDATSGLKLSNTNTDTSGQSDILFQRTANPVVNGTNTGIGQMLFEADNSGGSPFLFAGITAYATQFTAGSEEAFVDFSVEDGSGSRNRKLRIDKDGIEVTGTVTADTATFSSGALGDNLVVTSTSANTTASPDIVFVKDGGVAPIAEQRIGNILFKAPDGDNNATNVTYGKIQVEVAAVDASANTYSGQIDFYPQDETAQTTNGETVSMRVNETLFKVNNQTKAKIDTNGIDVTGTVTATGIALNGNMETDGDITVQNGHELRFEATDGTESFSIKTSGNTTTLHEQGSGNLNIKGDALVLQGNNRDLAKITVHDEGGVKIDSELGTDTTASYARIKVGNQHTGTRFYCGTDETNVRAEVVSAGLNVNGTVTADSITASQTAEVDTTNKTMANFKGQKVIHTGTTATYEFPDVVLGDKGTTWTIVNAGTGDITIARASGATPNFSKLVTSSNPSSLTGLTLAKGGTIEMVVTAADTITCFGSGF